MKFSLLVNWCGFKSILFITSAVKNVVKIDKLVEIQHNNMIIFLTSLLDPNVAPSGKKTK